MSDTFSEEKMPRIRDALTLLGRIVLLAVRRRFSGVSFAARTSLQSIDALRTMAVSGWVLAVCGWGILISGFVWQWWRIVP